MQAIDADLSCQGRYGLAYAPWSVCMGVILSVLDKFSAQRVLCVHFSGRTARGEFKKTRMSGVGYAGFGGVLLGFFTLGAFAGRGLRRGWPDCQSAT